MKNIQLITAVVFAFLLSSCSAINIFGHKVEIVNNKTGINAAGEFPDSSATLYHYPSGTLGVSAWGGGALQGVKPALKH